MVDVPVIFSDKLQQSFVEFMAVCLSFSSSTLWWGSLLHRDRAHSANCAEDRSWPGAVPWIGTRPSLCNDRAGWSRQFSLEVPQVAVPARLWTSLRSCRTLPEFPAKPGGATASVHRQGVAEKGVLAHFAHFSRSSGLSRS